MIWSIRLHLDMVPPITNPKAAIITSHEPSSDKVRTDGNDDVPILAWDAELNDESESWSDEVAAGTNDESFVKHKSRLTKSCHTKDEYFIAGELKPAEKDLIITESSTFSEGSLENKSQKLLHSFQSGIRSVVYNVIEHIMLGLIDKYATGNTLEALVEDFFDTNAAAYRPSQGLLTSNTVMAPTATLLRRKTDTTMDLYCIRDESLYRHCREHFQGW